MLHDDVDAIVTQLVLLDAQLLEADVVLEHLAEVNGHALADGPVHWVVDVELFQRVVARVKHRENTDDAVVLDFVVSEVERKHLVVREEQLSDHHRAICLDFVAV